MKRIWLLAILLFFNVFPASADELAKLDETTRPELLIKTSTPGVFIAAPAVKTDIALEVRGIVARGQIHQRFTNPSTQCVEAIYAFPLPENAAVDSMTIVIGQRRIEGQIKEKQEAQQTYEKAKSEGKAASLLEQQRPNLFTMSVASLGAGESVDIEIGYSQTLAYDDGRYSLRFPLAIGPRYQPQSSDPLPPMFHAVASPSRNPVSITVDLDAGIPLREVKSGTHAIESTITGATRYSVKLKDEQIASDRDFDLTWTPQLGAQPKAAVFTETVNGQRYALMMLFPQDVTASNVILPRETIFIIDTSGSMAGPSLDQAKRALTMAVDRLHSSDTFNVIEFNSTATRVFDGPRPADRDNIEFAKTWVSKLESQGGTEMMPALQMALENVKETSAVRQVIFMTDGQVGNESDLLAYIRTHAGNSRFFTVAIGAAPNAAFLRSGARSGRGTFTAITNLQELEEKMNGLFHKLESPVLSNIEVQMSDPTAEMWPPHVGDLYAGEPVVIAARYNAPDVKLGLRGRALSSTWSAQADSATMSSSQAGVAKLWARQKIESILDANSAIQDEATRHEIIDLGIAHHLVTPFTSLVAVDMTPAGVDPATCSSQLVPLNLPAGWGGVDENGSLPSTGTSSKLWMLIGLFLLLAAVVVLKS